MLSHVPWPIIVVALPLLGALAVRLLRDPNQARQYSLAVCGLTLVATLAAWADFAFDGAAAEETGNVVTQWLDNSGFVIDALVAPLMPLVSLVYLLTVLATLHTKARRLSFGLVLTSEAILLATFCCQRPWPLIALLALGTVPPWFELFRNRRPKRVYALHMALFIILLVLGQFILSRAQAPQLYTAGLVLLLLAALVRGGIVPLHCWMGELFEHASFATALLFVTPMVGAYAAVRLVLPLAPAWALDGMALLALVTALYAAGMALVQRRGRRFFSYIFLSHSSLVFAGLATENAIGMTGALCVWMAVTLAMAGFGLTLRSVEARTGRLDLAIFHGLYDHTPGLAALFLVTGLASIGFPGTVGFIGSELLVDGIVQDQPLAGVAVVFIAALNGLAVIQAYFHVFTGTRSAESIDLQVRLPERIAVLTLTALILGGGLYPQPNVASRYEVAAELVRERSQQSGQGEPVQASAPAHSGVLD